MITIQKEIKVPNEWVLKIIKKYERMPEHYSVSLGKFSGNRDDIVREIKCLTEIGLEILRMNYNLEQFEKSGLLYKKEEK